MHRGWTLAVAAAGCAVILAGCGDRVRRVGVDTEDPFSSTTTGSKDLLAIAQTMAREIAQVPQIANAKTPPTIAFAEVTNKTNEVIDKELFVRKMRTLLIKNAGGKMVFLDRAKSEEILRERDLKRRGQIGSSGEKILLGADYFLTGTISSIDKVSGGKRATFTSYAFRLTDTESSAIIWEDEYDVKKIGKAGVFDR
jgi:hypothetical protein